MLRQKREKVVKEVDIELPGTTKEGQDVDVPMEAKDAPDTGIAETGEDLHEVEKQEDDDGEPPPATQHKGW